ncbi:hypothetical protein FEK48_13305 [Escherichia sp. E2593]|uniref:hypothetical protein n=1 Tax=unclassified Escherichia TaxID=2608889 RepID=UPI0010297B8D|nr:MULTISPECIES: hypothetical protein [unclassified Escherichia]RZN40422.1 hypothetical protein D9738_13375 [Escherichia sp. E10V5]TGC06851.1 hypothetical protein CRG93_18625 [Escherichia sp. E2593]TLI81928.1 hypothetical protein FEK48_13305 [Escherichia sp. E2593]
MHIQQFNNLKKIVALFESDFKLSSQVYDRHVELIDAVSGIEMDPAFERALIRTGVRPEILEAAKESVEYEDLFASFISELTSVVAKLDVADQVDSARAA